MRWLTICRTPFHQERTFQVSPRPFSFHPSARSNNSFKPNLFRSTKHMAEKACHVFGSATQVGLTQALYVTDDYGRHTGSNSCWLHRRQGRDRKDVGWEKRGSVRLYLGGRRRM